MTSIIFDVCKILNYNAKDRDVTMGAILRKKSLCVDACVNKLLIKRICISTIVDLSFPL